MAKRIDMSDNMIIIKSDEPDGFEKVKIGFGHYVYLNQDGSGIVMNYDAAYKLALEIINRTNTNGSIN